MAKLALTIQGAKGSTLLPTPVRVAAALMLLLVIVGAWQLRDSDWLGRPETLKDSVGRSPMLAVALFVLVYAIAVLSGIPTLPMNLAAGWLWGPVLGGGISVLGSAGGAIIAFCVARTVLGQPLRRRSDNHFLSWAQQEFESKGWRFIAFIRLNPVFPSGPLNYLLGLTSIPAAVYVWASATFFLPPAILIAWIGSEFGRFGVGPGAGHPVRLMVIVSAAVTLTVALRYASRYLNQAKGRRSDDLVSSSDLERN